MKRCLLAFLVLLACGAAHAQWIFISRPVQDIAAGFARFDLNGDGIVEINSISLLDFEPVIPAGSGTRGLALVLVEPRLLASTDAVQNLSLRNALRVHRDDLVREGYSVRTLLLDVYSGPVHQDGRTLLAVRRFLKAVYAEHPLQGVTLVGSFPEASLMRRVLERKSSGKLMQSLSMVHERINPRAEIVLADLDGQWESLYRPASTLENLVLAVPRSTAFPYAGQNVAGTISRLDYVNVEDVFLIRDDFAFRSTTSPVMGAPAAVYIGSTAQNNPELSAADRTNPHNPIASPEILVSRIDAHGIAFNPTGPLDRNGRAPLDINGRPQAVEYQADVILSFAPAAGSSTTIDELGMQWTRDAGLEQRLLLSYFDRNHQHRNGVGNVNQYHVAAVQQYNSGLQSPYEFALDVLHPADPYGFGATETVEQANLYYYAYFVRTPSILKGVLAHSDGLVSGFDDHATGLPQNDAWWLVDMMVGGNAWAWDNSSNGAGITIKTPSAKAFKEKAGWAFARTLWQNRTLQYSGNSFYVHGGCSVIVPDDNYTTSYDDLTYGYKNNADSILLFQNGLGIMGRGKVFYDSPEGFGSAIASAGGRFGDGWRGYFAADAANAALKPGTNGDARVLSNKKSYFWALRGDWSLRLRY